MSTCPDCKSDIPDPERTHCKWCGSNLVPEAARSALRRFPEKGQEISREPEEWCFARDVLDCATIEEAHALAKRVLKEWSDFLKTC